MNKSVVCKKMAEKSPNGYRVNEVILFGYPVHRVRIDILVNKQPDSSLLKIYSSILQAIYLGFKTKGELFKFLGFSETDEFILHELFFLSERGYVERISNEWYVTEQGKNFIENNSILRVEENEDFEFFIDGISGDVISSKEIKTEKKINDVKQLPPKVTFSSKDAKLLDGKFSDIEQIYNSDNENKSNLISVDFDRIIKDDNEFCYYWLIEYIPEDSKSQDPYLEVRTYDELRKIKDLSDKFNNEYRFYICKLGIFRK